MTSSFSLLSDLLHKKLYFATHSCQHMMLHHRAVERRQPPKECGALTSQSARLTSLLSSPPFGLRVEAFVSAWCHFWSIFSFSQNKLGNKATNQELDSMCRPFGPKTFDQSSVPSLVFSLLNFFLDVSFSTFSCT